MIYLEIILGNNAEYIINKLNTAGYEAFAVGGCVRDSLLGREVTDIDITTSALPVQIKAVFSCEKVIETGIKHGTVTVIVNGKPYEITTYRTEAGYSDMRHPDKVTFVTDIKKDLSRRDFTVNAIAYSADKGLIDPFDGIADINNKLIRTVGIPEARFSEDALRIMRALRFSAVLGFKIESETRKAIFKLAHTVRSIAAERIYTELQKLLCGSNALAVIREYSAVLSEILPLNNDISAFARLPEDFSMRLTCLCGEKTINALNDLHADNCTKEKCRLLLSSAPIPKDHIGKKLYISRLGRENAKFVSEYRRALKGEDEQHEIESILALGECLFLNDLKIDGRQLQEIGFRGREIGNTLNKLLFLVITEKVENNKTDLLLKASEMKKEKY